MITYKEGLEIIQMIKERYLLSFKASISLIAINKICCIYIEFMQKLRINIL